MAIASKDPDATLDYGLDWGDWLIGGDVITRSTWVAPAGITVESETFGAATTTIWLSGGTDGRSYRFVNRITTAGGRSDERAIEVSIRTRRRN